MRRMELLVVALSALVVLGAATATSAFALPEISIALGGSYPIHLNVTLLTEKLALTSVAGEKLTGEGLLLLFLLLAAGHLGTFEASFQHVKNTKSGTSCSSEEGGKADPSGEALAKGTWHAVYTALSPLTLGGLLLVSPVSLKCGTEEIEIKGNALSAFNQAELGSSETTEYSQLGAVVKGNGAGKPSFSSYFNEAGTAVKAKLEANFGAGFKEAAGEAEQQVTTPILEGKMFVITSR